ncbi:MAG: excinuclease ABC subunit UvrB [Candidatus Micrarchaeia archaeon]
MEFKLKSKFSPAGGQPKAIDELIDGYEKYPMQTLLGITGSGKTFVIANLIEKIRKPTLIIAHNKTLAAQLYSELLEFFPENKVEYFISYYDYYQPESYIPTTDTYIEKEAQVNKQIEKMRMKTVTSLLSRNDVIVVASVSCIYGAGNPKDFKELSFEIEKNKNYKRREIISKLVSMQYERTKGAIEEGKFRVIGETIEIFPTYAEHIIRIEFFTEKIDRIFIIEPIKNEKLEELDKIILFPAKQFVSPVEKSKKAAEQIKEELFERLKELSELEKERLKRRVSYDLEMIEEMGYCNGIENYSRYFDGRKKGQPPHTLLDYFPDDFLLIIDESHQTVPQIRAMYEGDKSRKRNLVDYGFRLPSAYDNRPLKFEEFKKYMKKIIFVSATPSAYEIENSGQVVELIIRPTGLLDPVVEIRKSEGQIKDLIGKIEKTIKKGERILITTLTKKMAEDLTEFLSQEGIKVRYMHSEIQSLDRIEIIRGLRAGEFDVLVGINLLREGLDLPEVSLIGILDADKEGFLRDEKSLIQTIGRASRNSNGKVIMYADRITGSMKNAIEKTRIRREEQIEFNKKHGIIPKTIIKSIAPKTREVIDTKYLGKVEVEKKLIEMDAKMRRAAEELDFEMAIELRELIEQLKEKMKK